MTSPANNTVTRKDQFQRREAATEAMYIREQEMEKWVFVLSFVIFLLSRAASGLVLIGTRQDQGSASEDEGVAEAYGGTG